jgi:hypothetical protein
MHTKLLGVEMRATRYNRVVNTPPTLRDEPRCGNNAFSFKEQPQGNLCIKGVGWPLVRPTPVRFNLCASCARVDDRECDYTVVNVLLSAGKKRVVSRTKETARFFSKFLSIKVFC